MDAIEDAKGGYAPERPARIPVQYTQVALEKITAICRELPDFQSHLTAILEYDPRPAYLAGEAGTKSDFSMRIYSWDIKWRAEGDVIIVQDIEESL